MNVAVLKQAELKHHKDDKFVYNVLAKNFGRIFVGEFLSRFLQIANKNFGHLLKYNKSKFTPTKRALYGNNSFIASSRFYRCTDEKVTQIPAYLNQCVKKSILDSFISGYFSRPRLKSFELFC